MTCSPLHPSDVMFVTFDGGVIKYSNTALAYPIFINEAAHYNQGVATKVSQ
ncbi:succinylglutamate desuccinylase/aspartoacylase domain-containing protein [Leptothermofonsia sp. ETS-13]|uniref:succinylglutamate desuccinylase/aspartoacylase domain-containing protein n=1 Tax=Leptothermofonsia sp. ETS-13 TaxID=3035696 RepID=UPI003BA07498